MRPSVAILVLHPGKNPWTAGCLESLAGMDYAPRKVFLLDNGPADGSAEELLGHFPDITVVACPAGTGFAAANNLGAQQAGAYEYLWILNNDTRVRQDTLTQMVNTLQRADEPVVVGSVLLEFGGELQQWGGGSLNLCTGRTRFNKAVGRAPDYISGACMLMSRVGYLSFKGFSESYYFYFEDVDLSLRVKQAGGRLIVAESAFVEHKGSAASGNEVPFTDYHYTRGCVCLLRRHGRAAWLGIACCVLERGLRRLLRGRWACARAVWHGWLSGLRA